MAETLPLKVMLAASVVSVKFMVVAVKVPPMVVPPVWVNVMVVAATLLDVVNVPVLFTVRTSKLLLLPTAPVTEIFPEPVIRERSRSMLSESIVEPKLTSLSVEVNVVSVLNMTAPV